MKWSMYNHLYWSKRTNRWILYNSASGALIAIDDENCGELIKLRDHPESMHEYLNSDELIKAGVLVQKDSTAVDRKKLKVLQNRLTTKIFDLTVVPSLACNFKCTYCFQKDLPKYVMTEKTENNLVRFIKRMEDVRLLRMTWFGGEPLLALKRMQSLCRKVKNEVGVAFESHVITNGYLLNADMIRALDDLGVTFYQITIDGLEETHNRRRPLHNNTGTFRTIVNNIETLIQTNKDIEIAIRVNVDAENADEYHTLYRYFQGRFDAKKIHVHAGFVDNYSFSCSSVESCILNRQKRAKFLSDQYLRHGIYSEKFYPTINHDSCMARYINSFVVGPHGELYKCLSLVGVKEMAVGNVNNEGHAIENEDLLVRFLKGEDYLDNPECNQCLLFPVCDGGCPYLKMKEELFGEAHDACHVAKENLDEFLEMHIDMKECNRST